MPANHLHLDIFNNMDPPDLRSKHKELVCWLGDQEDNLQQVLQVRSSLEGLAAALATARATQDDLEQLRQIIDQQANKVMEFDDDYVLTDELARLDTTFHLAIGKLSGNELVSELIAWIIPAFYESNRVVIYLGRHIRRMLEEHRNILKAISSGDPDYAGQAMRDHVARVINDINVIY